GLGSLVRAVLGPEHAEHAQLDCVRRPVEGFDDDPVLVLRERHLAQPLRIGLAHVQAQETRTLISPSATERNSFRPSEPPRSASAQRSGCGIMPSTLPRLLMMPAMLCREPLGLAPGMTRHSASQ